MVAAGDPVHAVDLHLRRDPALLPAPQPGRLAGARDLLLDARSLCCACRHGRCSVRASHACRRRPSPPAPPPPALARAHSVIYSFLWTIYVYMHGERWFDICDENNYTRLLLIFMIMNRVIFILKLFDVI